MTAVQTLDRAVAILSLFHAERPEWAAADVARELQLTLPTTSRLMRALAENGMLMRVEGRRFRLGFGAVELGFRALHSIDVRERLRPVLVRLARESGETSVLGVIDDARDAARVIDRVEGRDIIRISLEVGHRWPLHAGALAKALLAHMPDRDMVLEQPLEKIAANTITDPSELRSELDQIRERGWAMSSEETDVGAWGVAMPIIDGIGLPIAAILLITPVSRKTPEYVEGLIERLTMMRAEARNRLGLRSQLGPR